ncbi:MAG: hAT family dimerization domain-containing protein, partial [Methylococcaceae bacterium]|nr:hAT family dimerization domain-containing protein [Methylococcaceae bacterium]
FHSLSEVKESMPPTLEKCRQVLHSMTPPMRAMFPIVESLVRLLLVNPASSATAERSFSSLRRLKTYLRSTCGQQRLNSIAICNVHKDVMDTINVNELMRDFVLAKDNRAAVFGHVEV